MGIVQINTIGNPKFNVLDLDVAVENSLDIRASSGSFKVSGVDYTLSEDDVITVDVDSSHETEVRGFLVKNLSTGNPEVLVDECVLDGIDVPFNFSSDANYKLLGKLYSIRVPAGTTDLSGLDLQVTRIVESE